MTGQCPIYWVFHKLENTSRYQWSIFSLCELDINVHNESHTHQNPSMKFATLSRYIKNLLESLNQWQNTSRHTTLNKLQLGSVTAYFSRLVHASMVPVSAMHRFHIFTRALPSSLHSLSTVGSPEINVGRYVAIGVLVDFSHGDLAPTATSG
jgi:hypothetical protein